MERTQTPEVKGLNDAEQTQVKNETGWSDRVVNDVSSMKEYDVLKKADLREEVCNGRVCLVKDDIDPNYVDTKSGLTNRERMERGRPPIDARTGEQLEIHHLKQKHDGVFVELRESEHGDGNHGILHTKMEDSWRNDPELQSQYRIERQNHWKARAKEL